MSNILKYQNPSSPLLNPHKIIENVPAREWGPRKINEDYTVTEGEGTSFLRAPFQYWGNKGLGLQNEKLARDLVSDFTWMMIKNPNYIPILDKNYQSYDDAVNYLNHLEGLKKYLGLPYDTGLLMESKYKPTRLQGTNEKTYKFKSSTVPGYWDDVVEDMVIGEHNKNQYYDQSLNEFTAYRDRDEKGDFVSIYDEWDYNPAARGGNKKLNKVIDSVTGGKPFVIYDRVYLDDYFDIPEEARGNPFITPSVVTAYKKGGRIHIKKKNRGSFTRWCKGKVTEECIRRGKNSSNPAIRKKATFAANARRWKHENGGILKAQEGTGNFIPHPLSPVGIALNQAKAMTKMKGEQQHLPPGVKEVVGSDGKKVAIRTEQPLVPLEQSIAEWLPGTGDVAEVGYIANDVKNGNYGTAALATAMVALPGNIGKIFRKSDIPTSKLTEAERLGIPKGQRSNPKALDNPQYWGYEQWNERYNKAVEEWDLDELQRLRDLHFITKAPGTQVITESGMPQRVYHFTSRRKPVQIFTKGSDTYPTPIYFTSNRDGLLTHDPYDITDMRSRYVRGDYYMKMENPLKEVPESAVRDYWGNYEFNELKKILRRDPSMSESIINYYRDRINGLLKQAHTAHRSGNQLLKNDLFNKIEDLGAMLRKHISRDLPTKQSKIYGLLGREGVGFEDLMRSELHADGIIHNVGPTQHYITYDPEVIKSAEPVTYDDFDNIIPIVKRDDFRKADANYQKGGKL